MAKDAESILRGGESFKKVEALLVEISADPGFHFTWQDTSFRVPHWNPTLSYNDDWASDCEERFEAYLRSTPSTVINSTRLGDGTSRRRLRVLICTGHIMC